MALKAGSMYIEIKADSTKYKDQMAVIKDQSKLIAANISTEFNTALGTGIGNSVRKLAVDINNLKKNINLTDVKLPTAELDEMAATLGINNVRFKELAERMVQTNAGKNAVKTFKAITDGANLSKKELRELKDDLGVTDEMLKKFDSGGQKAALGFKAKAIAIGALTGAIAALGLAAKKAYKDTLNLGDAAAKLDIPIENLSKLKYAAEVSSVGFETLKSSIENFSISMSDALSGKGGTADVIKQLGLDLKELSEIPADEAIKKIATAMQGFNASSQINISKKLFGGSGKEFLALLQQGGAGIDALYGKAASLGAVSTDIDYKKMQDAQNAMIDLQTAFGGLATELTTTFVPVITATASAIASSLAEINKYRGIKSEYADIKNDGQYLDSLLIQRNKINEDINKNTKATLINEERIQKLLSEGKDLPSSLINRKESLSEDLIKYKSQLDDINRSLEELRGKVRGVTNSPQDDKKTLADIDEIIKKEAEAAALEKKNHDERLAFYKQLQGITGETYEIINRSLEDEKARWVELGIAIEDIIILEEDRKARIADASLQSSKKLGDGIARALKSYGESAGDLAANAESVVLSSLSNMENALVNFVQTGKMEWKSMIDSMIADIARLLIRKAIIAPLAEGLGGLFSTPTPAPQSPDKKSLFDDAELFHGGGIVGLRHDEYPIIAQRGEMVLTPEQQQALGGNLNKSNVNVQIINNTSSKIGIKEEQTSRGTDIKVQIDEAVASVIASRGSRTQQALAGANKMVVR